MKYEPSSEYYNDICYSYTSEYITDITIKDRRNEYINKNMSLCENNCNLKGYNSTTRKALCQCDVKISIPLTGKEFNKDKLIKNFKKIKSLNLNVMKCYYTLLKKEGLKKNIGFYVIGVILLFTVILSILFKIKGYNKLKTLINEIVNNKKSNTNDKKLKHKKNPPIRKKKNKINIMKTNDELTNKSNSKFELKKVGNIICDKNKTFSKNVSKNIKNKKHPSKINVLDNKVIKLNDYEMNNLEYKDALKIDKRNYFQYYFSLLKMNHLIIFTFYTKNDYNSKIIKYILFLFSFTLYFVVNALFFNEKTMHRIYEDQGSFNFIYQIPQIIYSTFISSIISATIKYLSLSEKVILKLKIEKGKKENSSKILKCLNIKFSIFFTLTFIMLLLFWYYLSCFCSVYKNTQYHLVKDILISYGLSMIYPFIIALFPGLLRISSIKNKNRICLYNISKLMQLI